MAEEERKDQQHSVDEDVHLDHAAGNDPHRTEEDALDLDTSNISFPPMGHPKMNPCPSCGKMFFPWSLKTHTKRCGKPPAPSANKATPTDKDTDEDAFESLSEDSLKFRASEQRPRKEREENARTVMPRRRDRGDEGKPYALSYTRPVGVRGAGTNATQDSGERTPHGVRLDIPLHQGTPVTNELRDIRHDAYSWSARSSVNPVRSNSREQYRVPGTPVGESFFGRSAYQRDPFDRLDPHSRSEREDYYRSDRAEYEDAGNGGAANGYHADLNYAAADGAYRPSVTAIEHDAPSGKRPTPQTTPRMNSGQPQGTPYTMLRPSSRATIASPPAVDRQAQRTPVRGTPSMTRASPFQQFQQQFPPAPKSLSEKAREDKEKAEVARLQREEQLIAERNRLQKEIDRINDELKFLRAARGKSGQTITPTRRSPEPRRSPHTPASAPRFRPRFDDRDSGFNPRGIDPSNATSPDNPLATSIYQTMPHPPIVQRGGGARFIV